MLSFPPELRSVRGCQVHSVTRASAERTGRSSIDSERVTAAVCGTSRANKNQSSVQRGGGVGVGGVRQGICGRQILLLRRRGGPLDCGLSPGYKGGDDSNMDAARLSAECPLSPRTGCARAKLWAENESPLLVCLFLKAAVPQITPTPPPPPPPPPPSPPSSLHPTDPSHRDGWFVRQRQ